MPKLKSSRAAAKRFAKTGSGGFKHRQAHRSHILTKKRRKRKRHLRHMAGVHGSDQHSVARMLPYS